MAGVAIGPVKIDASNTDEASSSSFDRVYAIEYSSPCARRCRTLNSNPSYRVVPTLLRYRLTVVYSGNGFSSCATGIVGSPSDEDRGTMPTYGFGTTVFSDAPWAS